MASDKEMASYLKQIRYLEEQLDRYVYFSLTFIEINP